jgi:hypothetical protein
LTVEHAEAMALVLADPALYAVTGGEPPTRSTNFGLAMPPGLRGGRPTDARNG